MEQKGNRGKEKSYLEITGKLLSENNMEKRKNVS